MTSYKAVGLLSGGLDSALACKLVLGQGIDVHAVFIEMPWGCGKPLRAEGLAREMSIPFQVIPLGDDYLSILKNPKYGFGVAHNPCVDCHIYMVRKASEYMNQIGAEFVFTGEVLGQRPMSQRRRSLAWVEEGAGIPGRLLRPLSAKLMEPTIPEKEGIIDREKLLAFEGRNRRQQLDLASQLGLSGYSTPGGGCLLTERVFGKRVKDVLNRGCSSINEMAIIGAGRYFPLNEDAFVMLGRDARENDFLVRYALGTDMIFQTREFPGPVAVFRSRNITEQDLAFTAGLVQFFSKRCDAEPAFIPYWVKASPDVSQKIQAIIPGESWVRSILM